MKLPNTQDLLGARSGTLRGFLAWIAAGYVLAYAAYNAYALYRHLPSVASMPGAEAVAGYVLYYLGLRTDLPKGVSSDAALAKALTDLTDTATHPDGQVVPLVTDIQGAVAAVAQELVPQHDDHEERLQSA